MTEEHPQEGTPRDPSENADLSNMTHEDVEALVSQSESLVDDLANEVGTEQPAQDASESKIGKESTGDQTVDEGNMKSDIEQQLDNMDELLASAGDALGHLAEESKTQAQPADTRKNRDSAPGTAPDRESLPENQRWTSTSSPEIPTFMSEFTQPEIEAEAVNAGLNRPPVRTFKGEQASGVKAGVPSQPDQSDSGSASSFGDLSAELADTSPGDVKYERFDQDQTKGCSRSGPGTKEAAGISKQLAPLVFSVCDRGVSVLESLDKPLCQVNPGIKHALGFLAVATLGTAILVLFISLV